MDTFILKGKPKQTVTLEVDGHSLTFTEGIEIAVFVVVAAQHSVQRTVLCPECDSEILHTQYCMMGHWCGEPPRR